MFCFLNGITVKCHFCFEIVALYIGCWILVYPCSFLSTKRRVIEGDGEEEKKERKNFSDTNVLLKLCVF